MGPAWLESIRFTASEVLDERSGQREAFSEALREHGFCVLKLEEKHGKDALFMLENGHELFTTHREEAMGSHCEYRSLMSAGKIRKTPSKLLHSNIHIHIKTLTTGYIELKQRSGWRFRRVGAGEATHPKMPKGKKQPI